MQRDYLNRTRKMQPLFLLKESGEGAASAASHWAGLAGAR